MIDTPDARRMAVLSRGTDMGLRGIIPVGGHVHPSSNVGESLLWKKAQKKAEKNMISEVINKSMPHSIPRWTLSVWNPFIVLSRMVSRHHIIIVSTMMNRLRGKIMSLLT